MGVHGPPATGRVRVLEVVAGAGDQDAVRLDVRMRFHYVAAVVVEPAGQQLTGHWPAHLASLVAQSDADGALADDQPATRRLAPNPPTRGPPWTRRTSWTRRGSCRPHRPLGRRAAHSGASPAPGSSPMIRLRLQASCRSVPAPRTVRRSRRGRRVEGQARPGDFSQSVATFSGVLLVDVDRC
jgi:hypothetical protein